MKTTFKPSLWVSVLVGALVTASLIAVFYLAQQLVDTVFVPFDVFDWVGRVAPGGLITFGIDSIVRVITTLKLGELSSAAKTAELTLAIFGMFATGVVATVLLYQVLPRLKPQQVPTAGLIAGLIIGVPVMLISSTVDINSTQSKFVNAIWIILGFIIWGMSLGNIYERLSGTSSKPDTVASVDVLDRRQFLIKLGGTTAAITVIGAGLGAFLKRSATPTSQQPIQSSVTTASQAWSETNKLPNADDSLIPAPGTRPELTPVTEHYRIDINTIPLEIKESEWKLSITGLVEKPFDMTLSDLKTKYQSISQFVTLACISNPIAGELTGTTRWTGLKLKDLLADMKLQPSATHLKITAADNFDEFIDIETINKDERVMLAYEWDGLPLAVEHGFPLRIYIPNHYGMKQPKWITSIEAVAGWQEGWWVRRGWDKDAIMRAASVIDTVAVDQVVTKDNAKLVPIGGIAHAGMRGISKVEVKVDDGEWVEAQLRKPLSEVTWVIWRYDWPYASGTHTFTVRCYEGDGTPQIEAEAGSRPSGATGYHQVYQSA